MTWREVFAFLMQRERLRWTIRFLLVKLAFAQSREWWRGA